MTAIRYTIMGKVQGVGYRFFTQNVAQELGLKGWVANQSDGNVEVVVAGEGSALEVFEKKIRKGPPLSRVVNMERQKITEQEVGMLDDFEIRQ